MTKYINPLRGLTPSNQPADTSPIQLAESSAMTSESKAMNVVSSNICPKCGSPTVPAKLLSGEEVKFCTLCRVSLVLEA